MKINMNVPFNKRKPATYSPSIWNHRQPRAAKNIQPPVKKIALQRSYDNKVRDKELKASLKNRSKAKNGNFQAKKNY